MFNLISNVGYVTSIYDARKTVFKIQLSCDVFTNHGTTELHLKEVWSISDLSVAYISPTLKV